MSIERTLICDNCGGIIAADRTVRDVRMVGARQCGARLINGFDYCKNCLARGYPKSSELPSEETK